MSTHNTVFYEKISKIISDLLVSLSDTQHMNRIMRKPMMWLPNRSDTNRAVQAQEIARGWKFWITM